MKANIKKYNFLIFSLVLLFIAFYCTVSNAQPSESITRINPECTGNGGTITPASASNTCEFQPDTQKMTFYRLDLCTSRPHKRNWYSNWNRCRLYGLTIRDIYFWDCNNGIYI